MVVMTKAQAYMRNLIQLAHDTSKWGVNPDDVEELVIGDVVALEMEPISDDWVHFLSIRAFKPGNGAGSDAMKQVLQLADQLEVYLVGKIRPYDTKAVNKEDLYRWYSKFGSKPLDPSNPDGLWIRIPKGMPHKEPKLDKKILYRIEKGYSLDDYNVVKKLNSTVVIAIILLVGYLLRYKI